MTTRIGANAVSDSLEELLDRARDAHHSIRGDDATSLHRALDAGDALLEAKQRVARGQWGKRLAETGIPSSTARLYMRLAQHRDRIEAAECTSIREARELLTDRTSAPKPRRRHTVSEHERGGDRYDEGYEAGYTAGAKDGYSRGLADGQATAHARSNGRVDLDRRDVKWLVKLAHPDMHDGDLRATRVTQWLTSLMETTS